MGRVLHPSATGSPVYMLRDQQGTPLGYVTPSWALAAAPTPRKNACQHRSTSAGAAPVPDHHSHTGLGSRSPGR